MSRWTIGPSSPILAPTRASDRPVPPPFKSTSTSQNPTTFSSSATSARWYDWTIDSVSNAFGVPGSSVDQVRLLAVLCYLFAPAPSTQTSQLFSSLDSLEIVWYLGNSCSDLGYLLWNPFAEYTLLCSDLYRTCFGSSIWDRPAHPGCTTGRSASAPDHQSSCW